VVVPLSIIVSHVIALASALQCAHEKHLVHRGLKPENVLLGPKHEVQLGDFGLTLLSSDREPLHVNERYGTLSYIAPELSLGQPVPASDQYALAVMVYEWLCGHLPFRGSTASTANQDLYALPPSFSEKHPNIPCAVEQVVLKALSKEPAQRFVDVLSFALALEEASSVVSSPYLLPALRAATPSDRSSYPQDLHVHYPHSYTIPQPLTPLIGRERELQAARDLLLRSEVRLVTLTGTGGIGKTHLALTLGNKLLKEFTDGVCFVSLSTTYDSELVMPAIVHALGLQEQEDRSPLELLKTFLRDKHLLLVLDTFEQVVLAAPLLSDLLSSCPGLKLLVTSRAVLHVWGEYTYRMQPLEVPDVQQLPALGTLSHVASVALFVHYAQAAKHGFQLTEENARDVAEICSRLDGVPLALELAAASCQLLSPKALLSRLEHPLQVLTGGRRDAPPRHQTLRNSLSWNDDVLSPDEQTLFRRLAVFDGGFSLQAAEAIATAPGGMRISVLDGVSALIEKCMLEHAAHGGDEPRLYLLEVLREYGLERLAACKELEHIRDAHAAYYLALAEEVESVMTDANQLVWQERLEREMKNLRAAMEWLMERKQAEAALRLAAALRKFWWMPDYLNKGRTLLGQALAVSTESQTALSPVVRAKALYTAGYLAFVQNDPRQAAQLLEESQRLFHFLGDKRGEAEAALCLSTVMYHCGKRRSADTRLKAGARLYREREENSDLPERAVTMEATERCLKTILERSTMPLERSTWPLSLPDNEALTAREIEVLRLLATGLSNKQIGERLVLSPHTVSGHTQSIYGKLALNSRSAATRYALEHHLA
jgi:predicted ATPase/DNA-binding CsgD family transcriptional regulator